MRLSVCSLSWQMTFRMIVRHDTLSVLMAGLEVEEEDDDVVFVVAVLELVLVLGEIVLVYKLSLRELSISIYSMN